MLSSLAPFLPPQSPKACIPFCDPFPELPLYPPSPLSMLPWPKAGTPIRILHYSYFSYTPVSPTRLWAFQGLIHWLNHKQQIFNVYMCNVSPQGTYTLCDLSFIHWFSMITHSFIQCIWVNRPLLRRLPCMLIIKYLHHGVKWWPTLQWQRRGLMCSSVIVHKVKFPKNIRHSHGHYELEVVKKTTWDSESICNDPTPTPQEHELSGNTSHCPRRLSQSWDIYPTRKEFTPFCGIEVGWESTFSPPCFLPQTVLVSWFLSSLKT